MLKRNIYSASTSVLRGLSAILLLVSLSACSESLEQLTSKAHYPAVTPYYAGADPVYSQNVLQQPYVMATYGRQYRVNRNETLYSIARAHKVALRDIIDLNKIKAPFIVRAGQVIQLPKARTHVVQKGDTIYSLSRKYRVALNSLTNINNIAEPYRIRVGEVLQIPFPGLATGRQAATARPIAPTLPALKQAVTQPPLPPQTQNYRPVTAAPDGLKRLPTLPSRQVQTSQNVPLPQPRPIVLAQKTVRKAVPTLPPLSKSQFLWPIRNGNVVAGFGKRRSGVESNGIDISGTRGSAIRAAENGVVAFAGNGLRGYGNLILIQHQKGWVTAYAHTQNVQVSKGQIVKRGETIAHLGETGAVSEPVLHFEVRRFGEAVNPIQKLGGTTNLAMSQ